MRIVLALLLMFANVTAAAPVVKFKKDNLVGAWTYVESYLELPDGRRLEQFSDAPLGIFILLENGWYSHIILRPDLPRVKSGVMMQATPEEARLIAIGSLAHYGTYTVDENKGTFTVTILHSDFPNFDGLQQTRNVLQLDSETLRYVNDVTNAGPGAVVTATLKRIR